MAVGKYGTNKDVFVSYDRKDTVNEFVQLWLHGGDDTKKPAIYTTYNNQTIGMGRNNSEQA